MTELGDLTPPVVGARTRLHGHRAGRQRCQEREKLAAAQLLAKDHRARTVSPMKLKDVLGEIESDGAHLVHHQAPRQLRVRARYWLVLGSPERFGTEDDFRRLASCPVSCRRPC